VGKIYFCERFCKPMGKEKEDKAKQYSRNYKKFLGIVEEMSIISMALLEENACL
jgi:hypothetical protein